MEMTSIDGFFFLVPGTIAVAHCKRGLPAYSACAQYERRWKTEDHVCPDLYQGSGPAIRKPCMQEGRRGHE
jgi:hypothetical protein